MTGCARTGGSSCRCHFTYYRLLLFKDTCRSEQVCKTGVLQASQQQMHHKLPCRDIITGACTIYKNTPPYETRCTAPHPALTTGCNLQAGVQLVALHRHPAADCLACCLEHPKKPSSSHTTPVLYLSPSASSAFRCAAARRPCHPLSLHTCTPCTPQANPGLPCIIQVLPCRIQ
jgi:hypothetical protein